MSEIKKFFLDNKGTKELAHEKILFFERYDTISHKCIPPQFDCNISFSCQVWFIEHLGITELYKAVQVISTFGFTDDPLEQFNIFTKWKVNSEDINTDYNNLGLQFLTYQMRGYKSKAHFCHILNIQMVILDIVLKSYQDQKWSYDDALKMFKGLGNDQQNKANDYLSILILSGMIKRNKWIHNLKVTASCSCYKNINLRYPCKKEHCNQLLKALSAQIGKSLSYTRTVINEFCLRNTDRHDTILRGQSLYYFHTEKQISTKSDFKLRCIDAHCRVDNNKTFSWAQFDARSLIEEKNKIAIYLDAIKSISF